MSTVFFPDSRYIGVMASLPSSTVASKLPDTGSMSLHRVVMPVVVSVVVSVGGGLFIKKHHHLLSSKVSALLSHLPGLFPGRVSDDPATMASAATPMPTVPTPTLLATTMVSDQSRLATFVALASCTIGAIWVSNHISRLDPDTAEEDHAGTALHVPIKDPGDIRPC
jgi:hypothetical protein